MLKNSLRLWVLAVALLIVGGIFWLQKQGKLDLPLNRLVVDKTSVNQDTKQAADNLSFSDAQKIINVSQDGQTTDEAVTPAVPLDKKVYDNYEYDFSLAYPAHLGDVVMNVEKGCKNQGSFFYGTFKENSSIDFGFMTADYQDCELSNLSVFDIKSYSLTDDNKILLKLWDEKTSPVDVYLDKTISTNTANINAYGFKNPFDAGALGGAVAVVANPNRSMGALIFRITPAGRETLSYDEGMKLLESIIAE